MQVDGHDCTLATAFHNRSEQRQVTTQLGHTSQRANITKVTVISHFRWHANGAPHGSQDRPPTASSAGWAFEPNGTIERSFLMYEKPVVQRFGSLRELTLGQGANLGGDATSIYHRS